MLDTSGAPLDTGLQLNPQTPSDGSEYYDGPGEGPANPFGEPGLPGPAEEDGTFIDRPAHETKAVLNLILPKHAKVLINGKPRKLEALDEATFHAISRKIETTNIRSKRL